jgi:hypothetical protein
MKKIVTIWITVLLVTGLATSAFAFGPGWGEHGRYEPSRSYARGWQDHKRGHERGHERGYERGHHDRYNGRDEQRRSYDQHNRHHESSYGSGAIVSLPLLPGFGFWLPGISFTIH